MLARISQWRDLQVKKLKQNIGHIIGSIAAVLVLVSFTLMMILICVLLLKTILSVVGLCV